MMRQWAQRALEMDERNSRAWSVKSVAELLATPSRQRDALVAALRAATYGPRDAFAVNAAGVTLQGHVGVAVSGEHAGGGAAGSPLSLSAASTSRKCCC